MSPALFRSLAACLVMFALPAIAATVEYGSAGGGGRLLLNRQHRHISIEVVGVNGHTCDVKGRLTGVALDRVEAGENCSFHLQSKAQGGVAVIVDENSRDACRANCGARAWFEGDYMPLSSACTRAGLEQQQRQALQNYRAKRYDTAYGQWSKGLSACEKTMDWASIWRWRNDAAVAAAHAGRAADCRRLSQAVLNDLPGVTLPGETEPFTFAPTDADTARPLISAARNNLSLCDKPQ